MSDHEILFTIKNESNSFAASCAKLERFTSKLPKSKLILIAARPFMGKTALALQMVRQFSLHSKKPTAYFTLGLSKERLMQIILSAELEIDLNKIITRQLTNAELYKLSATAAALKKAPLYIVNKMDFSVKRLRERASQMKKQLKIEAIFIDYLQLMQLDQNYTDRKSELTGIAKELKAVAEELQIPVIALSQLTRTLEKRTDRRPILTDLLEYGEIEAIADLIIFLHRDSYYNICSEMGDMAEINIVKYNNGSTGRIYLNYCEQYHNYFDVAKA
jgi:replicative DNA helicase